MASSKSGLHHRMPTVFGPLPGPRQSFDGSRRNGSESSTVEAFITFKTTQSALTNLLPPRFSFQHPSPSGNAFVSIVPKSLDQLEWLGGRGYNIYSVYIHGVQHVAPDGQTYQGTFLPVLWEDLADPIISGREELGFPKLFSDLKFDRTENSFCMLACWRGARFCEFRLENLQEIEAQAAPLAPAEAGIDDGILLYRCVPAVGQPGHVDAEYPVFVSHATESNLQPAKVIRKFTTTHGAVEWFPLDWSQLPTLHHIVRRLRDIPISEIVACGVAEKIGMADLSSAKRIGSPPH